MLYGRIFSTAKNGSRKCPSCRRRGRSKAMNIHESAEDYLETILVLSKRMPRVRSVDIANEMNFSRPSVSVAMKHFRENGLITVDSDGNISLTDAGLEIAQSTYDRHMLLTELLVSIGVSEETAKEDACKIEHHISEETFEKLSQLGKRIKKLLGKQ